MYCFFIELGVNVVSFKLWDDINIGWEIFVRLKIREII